MEKELNFPTQANPDFWFGEFNVFKIDDARELNEAHLKQPIANKQKIFVVAANFLTQDAQNALLKIFEEPKAETVFFLILPADTGLLPTLKSRLIFESLSFEGDDLAFARKFLKAKVGARLKMVSDLLQEIKDGDKTKAEIIIFLQKLILVIKNENKGLNRILDIEKGLSYLNDESPSVKIILEHLACVL